MGASDNVNAAIAGAAGSVQDILSEYIKGKLNTQNKDYLAQRQSGYDTEQQRQKQILDNQNQLSQINAQGQSNQQANAAKLALPTTYRDPVTGEVVASGQQGDTLLQQGKDKPVYGTMLKSEAIAKRQAGIDIPAGTKIVDDMAGAGGSSKVKDQIANIDTALNTLDSLKAMIEPSMGKSGLNLGTQSVISKIPIVGSRLATDATAYDNTMKEAALQYQKARTGSSRLMGGAYTADVGSFPKWEEPDETKKSKFNKIQNDLIVLKNNLLKASGGEINPNPDIPNVLPPSKINNNQGLPTDKTQQDNLVPGGTFQGMKIKAVKRIQ